MFGMSTAEFLNLAVNAIATGWGIYQGIEGQKDMEDLRKEQERALAEAEAKQTEADYRAEQARLEALAAEQTGGNRVEASDFGIDSALARRYLDENNKRQAKAQQMLEEEENPFYTRGLV